MPRVTRYALLAALNPGTNARRLTYYWWLAEWKHTLEFGRPITDQAFHAQHLYDIDRIVQAFLDGNPRKPRLMQRLARRRLPKTVRAAIAHVRRTCDPMSSDQVLRLVLSTHPHLTLERGTPIDLPEQAAAYRQALHDRQQQTGPFVTLADRGVPSDSRTAQALLNELRQSRRALAITPEEGMQLLGANDMVLEYVPGLEHPWRVRYHHAPAAARDAPNRYTLHAHGSTWEAALTAALGVTVIAWQPPSQPVTA